MFSGLPCESHIAHIVHIARTVRVRRLGACRACLALKPPPMSAVTSSAGCRVTWENLGGLSGSASAASDTGGLCGVPRQADVLETGDIGGDKLSGLEFAGFSG